MVPAKDRARRGVAGSRGGRLDAYLSALCRQIIFALEVTWRRQAFLSPYKPLIDLRNWAQSVQSIIGSADVFLDID